MQQIPDPFGGRHPCYHPPPFPRNLFFTRVQPRLSISRNTVVDVLAPELTFEAGVVELVDPDAEAVGCSPTGFSLAALVQPHRRALAAHLSVRQRPMGCLR
jgi:hypothetical protein